MAEPDERRDQVPPDEEDAAGEQEAQAGTERPPAGSVDADRAASVEAATFSTVMRGYDKLEVDRFLTSLTERLRGAAAPATDDAWSSGVVKRELERVGESTKSILAAAEETARRLRTDTAAEVDEAKRSAGEHAERVRAEAEEFATSTREAAEEEARHQRLEAAGKADELVASAESRAEELLQSALRRRRVLEARIERLLERRNRVLDHLTQLSEQLSAMATAAADDSAESLRDEPAEADAEEEQERLEDEVAEGEELEEPEDLEGDAGADEDEDERYAPETVESPVQPWRFRR